MLYIVFVDLKQNHLVKLRDIGKTPQSTKTDDEIENFDLILDRIIPIGSFAAAYASKTKCNFLVFEILHLYFCKQ